jgi:hypothetical protein
MMVKIGLTQFYNQALYIRISSTPFPKKKGGFMSSKCTESIGPTIEEVDQKMASEKYSLSDVGKWLICAKDLSWTKKVPVGDLYDAMSRLDAGWCQKITNEDVENGTTNKTPIT